MTATWRTGRLPAVPLGEPRNVGEEQGIGDAALGGCLQRVFDQGVAAQALVHEIGVLPEFDALIEEMNQDVVELVARNGQAHGDHDHQPSPDERLSVAQHGIRQEAHRGRPEPAVLRGTDGEQRKHGRQEGDGENEGGGDAESDEVAQVTVGRHFGEVHAQETERRREARQKHRMEVEADGFDDGGVPGIPGAQALLQGHQQVHAVRHHDHQHDGRRRGDGRGKGQPGPSAQAHRRENGKDDDHPGGRHPRPTPGEDAEDQGHEQKARGQEDHLAPDRGFHEGLVDHDRADDAKVHAGKSFFSLGADRSGVFGNFGHGLQQAFLRQLDGDVHNADVTVEGQHAAGDARVGQGDGTDSGPRFGSGQFLRIHEIPHVQVVALGGGVLEIGEGVDAPRVGCAPGGFREPDRGRESAFRRGVTIVRNDQERDVLVLPVGILQRFQRQELRVVVVEEDAVVGGEFEPGDAA